jgi:hypothetical protein
MKKSLSNLSLPFVMMFVLLSSLSATAQGLTFFKCSPSYSNPSTNVYYSNVKVRVKGDQTGHAYFAVYSAQPSTPPSETNLYQWGEGAATPPGTVVGSGKIAISNTTDEFSQIVTNLTPNKNYYAYAMLQNSGGANGAVSSAKMHLMRGAKGDFYYFTEFFPSDYSTTTKKYPLMLFLHGDGESGSNTNYTISTLADIVVSGPPKHVTEMTNIPELQQFIVVSPQSPTNAANGGWSTSQIHNLITDLKAQYPRIDPNRIYVTGLSMGGFGTWKYALAHPEVPAAILPISGGGSKTNACLLADMPIWAWHDVPDSHGSAPSSGTIGYYNTITACPGYTGQMQMTLKTELDANCNEDGNHSVWNVAYGSSHSTPYLDDPCFSGSNGGLDIEESHTEMPPGTTVYKWMLWQTRGFRADAGADVELTAPVASYNLTGNTTSPAASYQWSKVSGASVTISNQNSATATVTGMTVGTSVFQLLATNSDGGMDIDLVRVTVNSGGGGSGKTVKIDFTTATPSSPNAEWNHFVAAGTAPASLSSLKYTDGSTSGYSIALTAPFNAATSNGMSTGIYPAYVMQSSWYTSGTATASLTISGLDNSKKYTLKLFGSRTDAGGTTNRNTEYAVGSTIKVVNASNNTSLTADHEELTPTNGSLTFTVKAQANASGYGYLNAMEVIEIAPVTSTTGTLKVDVCSGAPASPLPDWNHFAGSGAAGLSMSNLKYDDGTSTNYSVTVNAGFSSTTSNGMTGGDYPNTVAATSWYTSGVSAVASISLTNLNNAHSYTLKFFGSRTDAGGTVNRTTEYTVGSTTVTLNASNNINGTASISNITPTNGTITFTVKAAAGGQNYGYLNALEIIETAGPNFSMASASDETPEDIDDQNIHVYPTQITDQVNVAFSQQMNGRVSVSVMDINGKVYFNRDNIVVSNAESLPIDLSSEYIPKGIVVIKVISADGRAKTLRAYKE